MSAGRAGGVFKDSRTRPTYRDGHPIGASGGSPRPRVGTMTAVIPDSVRLALPTEAEAIAALQRRAWVAHLPGQASSAMLAAVDLSEMTSSWQEAIVRPPLAQYRVLVAVDAERITGFAAIGPSSDPDADPAKDGLVAEFVIDPVAQGRGHGSRLLNAVADTLRADGFHRATWWVRSTDDVLLGFLRTAGWDADGAHTEVAMSEEGPRLKLSRLHTALVDH